MAHEQLTNTIARQDKLWKGSAIVKLEDSPVNECPEARVCTDCL